MDQLLKDYNEDTVHLVVKVITKGSLTRLNEQELYSFVKYNRPYCFQFLKLSAKKKGFDNIFDMLSDSGLFDLDTVSIADAMYNSDSIHRKYVYSGIGLMIDRLVEEIVEKYKS